jgi:RimJ/RimL family protein N-acetyltransferase
VPVIALPTVTPRAITVDGRLAGTASCVVVDGDTEITCWVDRALWGRGVATEAVRPLLAEVGTRPLHARAAGDNAGSLRVLEKAGFRRTGTEVAFAPARGADIEEAVLRLD